MKPAFTLSAVAAALFSMAPLAHADYWATLAGANDSITLKTGETAIILSADNACVVQDTRRNQRPVQIEVGGSVYEQANFNGPYHRSRRAQQHYPVVLTGPAKVSVKTTNIVSMKVVQTQIEKEKPAAAEPPARAALWQSLASR